MADSNSEVNPPGSQSSASIPMRDLLPSAAPNARRRASKIEKEQIINMSRSGMNTIEIARQLNIHGHSVNGTIMAARKSGKLPPASELPTSPLVSQMTGTSVPVSGIPMEAPKSSQATGSPVQQQPVPQSSPAGQDDFSMGGRPVMGTSGGFSSSGPMIKHVVERIMPPDGLLGTHTGPFDTETLGNLYGEGQYKITRYEAGKAVALEHIVKIGPTYGQTRYPETPNQRIRSNHQNGPYLNRPYSGSEEDRPRYFDRPSSSGTDKAIEMMGNMVQKSLDQIESARKGGPDTYLTTFVKEQQQIMQQRWEEERRQKEEERKIEEEKWERQQRLERERYERDQAAERERHQRELDRIRAEADTRITIEKREREEREHRAAEERKFILELEDKKIALVRQEAEASQKRLESELSRTRDEMRNLQEKTTQTIEESQSTLLEQLNRDRGNLDREHQLREKALDTEHDLHRQMLEIQREGIQNSGGDHIFNTINTLIKEFSKGLSQVVDLKRLEVMTPEAQAAAVAQGSASQEEEVQAPVPQAAQQQVQIVPAQAAQSQVPVSTMAQVANTVVKNRLETMIQESLKKPFFQDVLKEWSLHIESQSDPTAFANLYMEMMRDETNAESRQACAAFATFMKPRTWNQIYAVFKDHVDSETKTAFQKEWAEEFYEGFKGMVLEQIREYWEQFRAERSSKNKQSAASPSAPETDQPETPANPVKEETEVA